jgi:hypothetical protein
MRKSSVIGIYDDFCKFLRALKEIVGSGAENVSTYTPVPFHEVSEILEEKTSPVRFFTLVGGLLGFGAGVWIAIYCSTVLGQNVGGKPMISIPPFLIIAFELAILFGAILSGIGYLLPSLLSRPRGSMTYDPAFSEDRYGIYVEGSPPVIEQLSGVMKKHGAIETRLQ